MTNLSECARLFLEARTSGTCLKTIAEEYQPQTLGEAYSVQDHVAKALTPSLGPVRGWKVGADTPESEPFCAPLHERNIFSGSVLLPTGTCRLYGVEAELVYVFGKDLPSGKTNWTEADIADAIGSIHSAIEICDTRFCEFGSQKRPLHVADQLNHGALIYGRGLEDWRRITPVTEHVRVAVNGQTFLEHDGGNSAGDPLRMLVWLAHHAAERGLPLKAGTIVTTGSMSGTEFVPPGTRVTVQIGELPPISVSLP